MISRITKLILSAVLISALAGGLLPRFLVFAQISSTEERQQLEEELKRVEEEILQYEKEIKKTGAEKKTLQNKISTLKNQIKKLDLQINQSNIVIKDLTLQITDTESSIHETSLKIDEMIKRLSAILRAVNEEDQKSLVEVLLSDGISDFFDNLVALEALSVRNKELLADIKSLKSSLEKQRQSLDEEKDGLEKQVIVQNLQKKESENTKKDQEYFLKLTEAEYQSYVTEKEKSEKKAQSIRSRIFELIGVPEAPTFGQAYEIAKYVQTITGIRPALLLAVLTQESNIGKNVGQCFLTNTATGGGVRSRTKENIARVMNPSRDVPPFLEITKNLGRDPYNTPVSCPMSIGWGGAMGPAQFIASTWMSYDSKIKNVIGKQADPWNIKDAFLATGLYLKDLGAAQNESKAAAKYFAGNNWQTTWARSYSNSVLSIAGQYEQDIKSLQ